MSTKFVFSIMIAFSLLVVIFLAAQFVSSTFSLAPGREVAMAVQSLAGSDWIERHPEGLRSNYYAGSDYIERHPSNYIARLTRLEKLARIKDDVFPVITRLTGPSRLEELARIKGEMFPLDTHPTGPSRLEELARIKER